MYSINYYTEDWIVRKDQEKDLEKACETACCMDIPEWEDIDPDETSLYVEVVDEDDRILLWLNTEGERGSDYGLQDEETEKILRKFLW